MGHQYTAAQARQLVRALQLYPVFTSLQAMTESLDTAQAIRDGLVWYGLPNAAPCDNADCLLDMPTAMVVCVLRTRLVAYAAAEAKSGVRPVARVGVA